MDFTDRAVFADVRPNVYPAKSLVVDKQGTHRMELLILSLRTRLLQVPGRRASGLRTLLIIFFCLFVQIRWTVPDTCCLYSDSTRLEFTVLIPYLVMLNFAEACLPMALSFVG